MKKNAVKQFHTLRWLSACLSGVLLASALWVPAWATGEVDADYTGPLDTVTGEAVTTTGTDEDSVDSSTLVKVSESVTYDRGRMAYIYTVNGFEVACSAVDGMLVQGSVSIVPDDGLALTIYRNGEALGQQDIYSITENGDYTVEATVSGQSQQVLKFSIVGEALGSVDRYTMPSGFVISDVTRNGEEAVWDRSYVDLTTEGDYVITYSCARVGVSYQLDVNIDHTAPTLTIEGLDEDNCARGPVTLSDIEEGATVAIQHDEIWGNYQQTLTESGEYRVRVIDEAGNYTDYYFTILIYFDSNSFLFLGLVLAVIAATVAYVLLFRKRLRVR